MIRFKELVSQVDLNRNLEQGGVKTMIPLMIGSITEHDRIEHD